MTTQFAPLLDALRALKSSSADGFEGLIRDLLETVAGRTIRLVKSGPQGGKDFLTDPRALAPGVAVEAKRFGAKTDLQLDELKSKLRDAIESTAGLDVWAIALSREMKQPDWSQLQQVGAAAGVALLCLDWRDEPGALPVVAALCAAGRHITEQRLTGNFATILDQIEVHPRFGAVIDDLHQQLTAPEVGFDVARDAARQWLENTLASLSQARQRLRSYADIRSSDAHLVDRQLVSQRLDQWRGVNAQAPAVLLGDEGAGKTWAALSWCLRQAEGSRPPLVLAVSAKDIQGTDVAEILANLMRRVVPTVSASDLQRRFDRWASSKAPACHVLLLIDGLNEAWDKPWHEIVRLFDTDPWREHVSLLLTCRAPVWRDDLLRLQGACDSPIVEIEVPHFSDSELDSYLGTFGLDRGTFSKTLLAFIRIPRFARLAISLRAELGDAEDITVARLVLEDWRLRLKRRGSELRLDDESLLKFVAGLGNEVLADEKFSLSQQQIHERLAENSGQGLDHYRATIDELVGGIWLKRGDKQHQYVVDKRLLPYAIGLDLAQTVESLSDRAAVEQVVAEYQDPLRGADLGVAILRAATTISFARGKTSSVVLETLLKTWLSEQNFNDADFEEMWRHIALQPALVLHIAEESWRQQPVVRREGELLAKGLANAAKWPVVQNLLIEQFPRWVGAFGLDAVHWYHHHIPYDEERASQTLSRLSDWLAVQPRYHRRISSHLRQDEDDYLPEATLAVMSYLPRAPFTESIVTWAVTRAVMDFDLGAEQYHWLLRINSHDHVATEAALVDEIRQLKALQSPVAAAAANIIAKGLATPSAMELYTDDA